MSAVLTPAAWGKPARLRLRRPGDRRSVSRSATRALDVLELFGEVRRPLRAADIARLLDLSPSTTGQLLKTMVDSAHLVFDARGKRYAPSPRLAGFGAWMVAGYGVDSLPQRLVREVQAATGGVVTLATANGSFMQLLDAARGSDTAVAERGLAVPLFGSAIGAAHLATLDDGELCRLAARAGIPDATLPEVRRSLSQIRLDGYADGPTAGEGSWSVAMALPAGFGPVPLVLGFAGPGARVREDRAAIHRIMQARVDLLLRAGDG